MTFYLAPSLVALRGEINARWPNRDKASDGWIGDPGHAARISDHNPDEKGCVHALDVDVDGINVDRLLKEAIGDPRVWYVIHNRKIYSRTYGWTARAYYGSNPHQSHVHISIRYTFRAENDTGNWFGPRRRTKGGRLPIVDLSKLRAAINNPTEFSRDIRRVQACLNARYDLHLRMDGWWGENTQLAYLLHEQHSHAPKADGYPGPESLAVLVRGRYTAVA